MPLTLFSTLMFWVLATLIVVMIAAQSVRAMRDDANARPQALAKRAAGWLGLDNAPIALVVTLLITWALVAGTLLFGVYKLIWDVIWHTAPNADEVWTWRFTLAQLAALTTVLGAVIALPLTLNRLVLTQRQTKTIEQRHITERINAAVEGLAAEKTASRIGRPITVKLAAATAQITQATGGTGNVTRIQWREEPTPYKLFEESIETEGDWQVFSETTPNLEVRIGALYALERIMQDSERDHIQIMEILCAYIRQNAQTTDVPLPDDAPTPAEWQAWAQDGQTHLRLDVDVALRVIERRAEDRRELEEAKGYRPGLERAPLRKLVLGERKLPYADLRTAQLQGAELRQAQLQRADLGRAQLQGANLWGAQLQGADLEDAQLQGANLRGAQLQGADLEDAQLQGANLWDAEFDSDTSLRPTTLKGASVRGVDFTNLPQIKDHLTDIFGDGSVTLPGGHGPDHPDWPDHWPKEILDYEAFEAAWRAWQKTLDDYDPDLWGVPETDRSQHSGGSS